jgi:hypothetical protein
MIFSGSDRAFPSLPSLPSFDPSGKIKQLAMVSIHHHGLLMYHGKVPYDIA